MINKKAWDKMKKLSIYIHIPFCVRKCLYCDFLSAPADQEMMRRYVNALCREIIRKSSSYKEYIITTVFIGGGTPSILPGEWIEKIVRVVRENYQMETGCEISLEANPGTITSDKLEHWCRAGVNRLSIGLQSAKNNELEALGRIHSFEDFLCTYELVIKYRFNNINIDLMSAIPMQTLASWQETLKAVCSLNPLPVHISAYSLIVEENTPFYENPPKLPEEDEERNMYKITNDILSGLGYIQYEISNYAKSGYECRHNQVYWRRGNYLGFGLGAASMVENVRYSNIRKLGSYINFCESDLETMEKSSLNHLSKKEQMEEFMFLGLRMVKGVCEEEFYKVFGTAIEETYQGIVEDFCRKGLLKKEFCEETGEHRIMLTRYGIDVSNYVMAEFLLS